METITFIIEALAVVGLAWALSIFGATHKLKKPFSCELCMTFWLCVVWFVSQHFFYFVSQHFFYVDIKCFLPLFILKVIYLFDK